MAAVPAPGPKAEQASAPPEGRLSEVLQGIMELSSRGLSPSALYRRTLGLLAGFARSPFAAVEVRLPTEVIRHEHHDDSTDPSFWKPTVQSALTEAISEPRCRARLYGSKRIETQVATLALPITDAAGKAIGAIVMMVFCRDKGEARALLERLHLAILLTSLVADGLARPEQMGRDDGVSLQTLTKVAGYSSRLELAYSLTNNLSNRTGSEQVALGLVRGRRVDVVAISGMDGVVRRNPGVQRIQAAMGECLDRGRPIVCQREMPHSEGAISSGHRLHLEWHRATAGDAVASIPLPVDGECVAVLCLRRRPEEPFTEQQLAEIRELMEPFAGALDLVDRASWKLFPHALVAWRDGVRGLLRPGGWGKKALLGCALAAVVWFFAGTLDHEITVPCVINPMEVRHVGAPGDAVLRRTYFAAGDRVRAGDVLCEFDAAELELEARRLESQISIMRLEEARSRAEGTPVEARLAQAELRQLEATRDIVRQRIDAAVVSAPFDAIVVAGDLRDRAGDILLKGEPLFELSREKGWTLEMRISESEVARVAEGMVGRFALRARPDEVYTFRVTRVRPDAELLGGRNVFVAEAESDIRPVWIRSGMEGIARIEAGRRSVLWHCFHRLHDRMLLSFWL